MKKKDNPIPPAMRQQMRDQVVKGLKTAAKVVTPMAVATIAAFKRKPEEKLESKGMRQAARAERKTARAEKITARGGSATRAAKLTSKASNLKSKSAANLKAAEVIYKSKNPKMK
jgi:hypothetical protein